MQLPKALGAEDEEKEEETVKYAERRHAKVWLNVGSQGCQKLIIIESQY